MTSDETREVQHRQKIKNECENKHSGRSHRDCGISVLGGFQNLAGQSSAHQV